MGDPLQPSSRLLLGHGHSPRALQPRPVAPPPPPSRPPGLSGLGSPRGARARFSEGVYAIAAAQLRAGPLRRVNSGGRAAWVYSNAVDVTSSLRDVDGRKGSVSRFQNPSACSTGRAPGLGGCVQEGTGGRRGWRGQWREWGGAGASAGAEAPPGLGRGKVCAQGRGRPRGLPGRAAAAGWRVGPASECGSAEGWWRAGPPRARCTATCPGAEAQAQRGLRAPELRGSPRIHPNAGTDLCGRLTTQRTPSPPRSPEPASSAPAWVVGFHPVCDCAHGDSQGRVCAVPRSPPGLSLSPLENHSPPPRSRRARSPLPFAAWHTVCEEFLLAHQGGPRSIPSPITFLCSRGGELYLEAVNHIPSLCFWATFVETKVQFSLQVRKIRAFYLEPVKRYLRNVLNQNMETFHLMTWSLDRHT